MLKLHAFSFICTAQDSSIQMGLYQEGTSSFFIQEAGDFIIIIIIYYCNSKLFLF